MKTPTFLSRSLRYKPWQGRHLRLLLQDLAGPARQPEHDHRTHLRTAVDWLCRAHDRRRHKSDAGGVAAGWRFDDGWLPACAESTGYLIETFIAATQYLARPELIERAQRMLDWLLSLQAADGGFRNPAGLPDGRPVFVLEGPILHGLIAGHTALHREDCLMAAVRAGNRLVAQYDAADSAGRVDARTAWALAGLGVITGESAFVDLACRTLDAALDRQTPSGWFVPADAAPGTVPPIASIACAIRGFVEVAVLLGDARYLAAGEQAARALMAQQRTDGSLCAHYDDGWMPSTRHVCIAGVAQMALCWLRLAQCGADARFRDAAWRALAYVKHTQRTDDADLTIRGALPGSAPLWGGGRFAFPTRTAKFFCDALMMDMANVAVPPVPLSAAGATR